MRNVVPSKNENNLFKPILLSMLGSWSGNWSISISHFKTSFKIPVSISLLKKRIKEEWFFSYKLGNKSFLNYCSNI